jgi:predicted aldo/keto reductase-like oxidoreductase
LDDDDDSPLSPSASAKIAETTKRLDNAVIEVLGADWVARSMKNLPDWHETPGNINIPVIIRLWNLAKGLNMVEYAKMRYNLLGAGGHWFPGENAGETAKLADDMINILKNSGAAFPEKTVEVLQEAHSLLHAPQESAK